MKGAQVSGNLTTESRSIQSGQGKSMWLFPLRFVKLKPCIRPVSVNAPVYETFQLVYETSDTKRLVYETSGIRVNPHPTGQLAPSHPRTLTNSHPDQHVRLPRRGPWQCWPVLVSGGQTRAWLKSHSPKLSDSLHGRDLFLIFPNPLLKAIPIKYIVDRLKLCSFFV